MDNVKKRARVKAAKWYAQMPERRRRGQESGLHGAELRVSMEFGLDNETWEQADLDDVEKIWSDLDFAPTLGERIRLVRRYYSLTQWELAEVLNVKQASVSRWEKNKADPSEEVIEILGYMVMLSPGEFRYGRREPISTGELVPEKPVIIVGELDADGSIELFPRKYRYMTVERPREGRPHLDVVGIVVADGAGFSLIQGSNWMFFYREDVKQEPGLSLGQVCIVKVKDSASLTLAMVLRADTNFERWAVMLPGGVMRSLALEWASPVLSFRQDFQRFQPSAS